MDTIKEQANLVGQLLFSSDTGDIYKKTLARTWDILREVGVLLWLVICLTFVGGEWFYRTAVGLGRSTRAWYIGLSEKDTSDAQPMASSGQALLDTVKSGTSYLLAQARQQLGLPEPEPKPAAPPAPAPPVAPPPTTPDEPTPSGPPAPAEPPTPDEPLSPVATVSVEVEDEDGLVE